MVNGGIKKIDQWFLANDNNFNAITAERYIINYLQQQNRNLVDNISSEGIDAYLDFSISPIGIEITTLNGFVASWILLERLTQHLENSGLLKDKGLEIICSHKRIWDAARAGTIYDLVEKASNAIFSDDDEILASLDISVEFQYTFPGSISFNFDQSDDFPWFKYITDDLYTKLSKKEKANQLREFPRNLVFVGVNHLAPSNWIFPSIFEDLVNGEKRYPSVINELKNYWLSYMASLSNVIGICYFFYSLDREEPFYPPRIFWRSEADKIDVTL